MLYTWKSDFDIGLQHDLNSFSQPMNSENSPLWYDTMKEEMNSMAKNVWVLIPFPIRVSTVGCKWVFDTRRDSFGNIEQYIAKFVAKSFTQKKAFDYHETFLQVFKKNS
ncbi:hypothetical protein ACH5RR_029363 [Cinchona calisaya]|uniref:Reverse transcriptase n=1 Tax=Cinchona calisaya TaxID=153742 RepID=A0ABD2YUR4_9GENT